MEKVIENLTDATEYWKRYKDMMKGLKSEEDRGVRWGNLVLMQMIGMEACVLYCLSGCKLRSSSMLTGDIAVSGLGITETLIANLMVSMVTGCVGEMKHFLNETIGKEEGGLCHRQLWYAELKVT